jgi:DNA-binding MarR family transcriptional regulator
MMLIDIMRNMRRDLGLSLSEAQFLLLIAAGTHEDKPWTASAAAAYLGEPRQTINRHAHGLVRRGFIRRERRGRSIVLRITDSALIENNSAYNDSFNRSLSHVRRFVRRFPNL